MQRVDALVVGGGIAGSATAAALAQKGIRVLVCEAGLPNERRLAGELMHPPSAARLEQLGLLEPLLQAGAVPSYGFVLFRGPRDPGNLLSYSEIPGGRPTGIALDHALMTRTLLSSIVGRPGVDVWKDARVTAIDFDRTMPHAQVVRAGSPVEVEARMIVSAEGRESNLRAQASIATAKMPAFRMVGWKVRAGRLPYPGYGHVFLGGGAPTLAYQVSRDEVRIMFENGPAEGTEVGSAQLEALPEPFRSDVRRTMAASKPQVAKVYGMTPTRYTAPRLALVGDAGGCVHPITASGISYCTSDALELAECLAVVGHEPDAIPRALALYEKRRKGPMRTRTTLGPVLLDALSGRSPELSLLRSGLFRYWTKSPRGRRRSLSLLSTQDQSMHRMLLEYSAVAMHAFASLTDGSVPGAQLPYALQGLFRTALGQFRSEA